VADAFQRLIDGIQLLIREHLALARVELRDDLRALGRDLFLAALGVPLLVTGYLIAMISLALGLTAVLLPWAAFGAVALANLAGGAILTLVSVRRASSRKALPMSATTSELAQNRARVSSLAEPQRTNSLVQDEL